MSTSWNFLDAGSPLRSKRIQGLLIQLGTLAMVFYGIDPGGAEVAAGVSSGQATVGAAGVIWSQIGQLMSKNSSRDF